MRTATYLFCTLAGAALIVYAWCVGSRRFVYLGGCLILAGEWVR